MSLDFLSLDDALSVVESKYWSSVERVTPEKRGELRQILDGIGCYVKLIYEVGGRVDGNLDSEGRDNFNVEEHFRYSLWSQGLKRHMGDVEDLIKSSELTPIES